MQYLKEEIKNRILEAALNEFKENGFSGASMRKIAQNAGVALGNVYRYFESKDELFNSIMEPVYNQFTSLVLNVAKEKGEGVNVCHIPITDIIENVEQVFVKYSAEFLVMLDKSEGSKYENTKEELVHLIDSRLKNEMLTQFVGNGVEIKDDFITYILAHSTVEAIVLILRRYTDEANIKHMLNQLLLLFFNNIHERFK